MKKKSILYLLSIIFIFTILAVTISVKEVLAFQICEDTIPYAGRTLQSCKDNWVVSGNQYWAAKMATKVVIGSGVTSLGWDIWTNTRYCNNNPIAFDDRGSWSTVGVSAYGYSPNYSLTNPSCWGVHESRVYGKHFWQQTGYPRVEETWPYWLTLP